MGKLAGLELIGLVIPYFQNKARCTIENIFECWDPNRERWLQDIRRPIDRHRRPYNNARLTSSNKIFLEKQHNSN